MLDPHGFVATCNSTHFFIVAGPDRAPEVLTSDGRYCLAGITRANVLEMCRANDMPARETTFSLTDVYAAREAFVKRVERGASVRGRSRQITLDLKIALKQALFESRTRRAGTKFQ